MDKTKAVNYLCSMIVMGVNEKDKDCVRSHVEDLNLFLQENGLMGE